MAKGAKYRPGSIWDRPGVRPIVKAGINKAWEYYRNKNKSLPSNTSNVAVNAANNSSCTVSRYRAPSRSNKLPKGVKRLTAKQTYTTCAETTIQLRPGCQTVVGVNATFNGATTGIHQQYVVNRDMVNRMVQVMRATNPSLPNIDNPNIPMKWQLNKVNVDYVFKNQTNVCIDLDLYTIVPKRDIVDLDAAKTPLITWANGLQYATPTGGITPAPVGPSSVNFPGTTPFMSETFCQYYTVKRRQRISMSPGGQHEHHFTYKPNSVLAYPSAVDFDVLRKHGYSLLAVARGTITRAETTPTAPTTPVTTAFGQIICAAEAQYSYTVVERNSPRWFRESNLFFEERLPTAQNPYATQRTVTEGYNEPTNVMQT